MPFLLVLLQERRWQLLGFYVAAYGAIGLFWMWWPLWISSHGVAAAASTGCVVNNCNSGAGFVDRIVAAFGEANFGQHISFTGANMLRFVVWQHPILMPLAVFGAFSCWKCVRIVPALALGLVLPIAVIGVILPWQGHGWGYRYLHPVLGNAILLACYGFQRLKGSRASIRVPLIVTTSAALALLAVHAWMAAHLANPYVQVRDELNSSAAEVVIADTSGLPLADDVILNRFDLSNRPILLIADRVDRSKLRDLCERSTITFYDAPRFASLASIYNWPAPDEPSPHAKALHNAAKEYGCRIVNALKAPE